MSQELQRYFEPLNTEEVAFLVKKERREKRQYYKAFRFLMVLCFVIPFGFAWYRAAEGAPNAFSLARYFIMAGVLLTMSASGTWISYQLNLRKVQQDIKNGTKTIEISHILKKMYMPQTNTYHFYLDSPTLLSIEVSSNDYHRQAEGDELNIEYTTYSKMFLGYF